MKSNPPLFRGPKDWPVRYAPLSARAQRDPLADGSNISNRLLDRAHACIQGLVTDRIGGDCFAPELGPIGDHEFNNALLIVCDDYGLPDAGHQDQDRKSVERMMNAARTVGGDRPVLILTQSMHGLNDQWEWRSDRTHIITRRVDPWSLFDRVDQVFTLGHEIGFLGLLAGKIVRCFGTPDYARDGLTDGAALGPQADRTRSLAQLFAEICILGARYRDPFNGQEIDLESAVAIIADWKRAARASADINACLGMSIWKQRRIGEMLRSHAGGPRFANRVKSAVRIARENGGSIAVWATREPAGLAHAASIAGIPVVRIEDGFLRSVGLGANFTQTGSIVLDPTGIYFDPNRPSGLDFLLNTTEFDPRLKARAERLIAMLANKDITKYNTGGVMPKIEFDRSRRLILVPGQVEDDRSVLLGGGDLTRNIDLLVRVRGENPDAAILYKPHPDVESGHRPGAIPDRQAMCFANLILRGVSSAAAISAVDEIQTLTSLAGFEAIIRGKHVVVHGRPFYAGWGLSEDRVQIPHRTRKLSLEELVAGALILYPLYIDPVTRLPCGPEQLIERLADDRFWKPGLLGRLRLLQGAAIRRFRKAPVAAEPGL